MELTCDIWRWHNDCKWFLIRIYLRMKLLFINPLLIQSVLNISRIIIGRLATQIFNRVAVTERLCRLMSPYPLNVCRTIKKPFADQQICKGRIIAVPPLFNYRYHLISVTQLTAICLLLYKNFTDNPLNSIT